MPLFIKNCLRQEKFYIMNADNVRNEVKKTIEKFADDIIAVGEHIWKNPEPGYREVQTSAFLVDKLEKLGLKVRTGLAVTGFRADIDTGRPGPTVAILGELDSLILPNHPECDKSTGAIHACGHNSSAASLYGAAVGLIKSGVLDSMCGKIAFIGCPAEEGIELDYRKTLIADGKIKSIAGKSQLIREGVFDDVNIAYMHHLGTAFAFNGSNGAINKKIIFRGKSCHAAAPQGGKNALNAMTLALNAIAMLRESYSNDKYIRIHGIVNNGGDSVNIIPDVITMEYMLRAIEVDQMLELNKRFDNAIIYAAKAAECEAEIESLNGYMPTICSAELEAVMKEATNYLHPEVDVSQFIPPGAGSTDMGDVSMIVPAIHAHAPGAKGLCHGIDYGIADKYASYIDTSILNAIIALDLLFGDGAKGAEVAATQKDLMSVEEYIKTIDSINGVISSLDF